MSIDHAALDRITDIVLRYRPPNKGLKTAHKIDKSPEKINQNKSNTKNKLVDSEK